MASTKFGSTHTYLILFICFLFLVVKSNSDKTAIKTEFKVNKQFNDNYKDESSAEYQAMTSEVDAAVSLS